MISLRETVRVLAQLKVQKSGKDIKTEDDPVYMSPKSGIHGMFNNVETSLPRTNQTAERAQNYAQLAATLGSIGKTPSGMAMASRAYDLRSSTSVGFQRDCPMEFAATDTDTINKVAYKNGETALLNSYNSFSFSEEHKLSRLHGAWVYFEIESGMLKGLNPLPLNVGGLSILITMQPSGNYVFCGPNPNIAYNDARTLISNYTVALTNVRLDYVSIGDPLDNPRSGGTGSSKISRLSGNYQPFTATYSIFQSIPMAAKSSYNKFAPTVAVQALTRVLFLPGDQTAKSKPFIDPLSTYPINMKGMEIILNGARVSFQTVLTPFQANRATYEAFGSLNRVQDVFQSFGIVPLYATYLDALGNGIDAVGQNLVFSFTSESLQYPEQSPLNDPKYGAPFDCFGDTTCTIYKGRSEYQFEQERVLEKWQTDTGAVADATQYAIILLKRDPAKKYEFTLAYQGSQSIVITGDETGQTAQAMLL